MSEDERAAEVQVAVNALNSAILAAVSEGMRVDVDVRVLEQLGTPTYSRVRVDVFKLMPHHPNPRSY